MSQTVRKEPALKKGKKTETSKKLTEEHFVNNRHLQCEKRRNVDFHEPRTFSVIFVLYG